jgi:hypothetical protein
MILAITYRAEAELKPYATLRCRSHAAVPSESF